MVYIHSYHQNQRILRAKVFLITGILITPCFFTTINIWHNKQTTSSKTNSVGKKRKRPDFPFLDTRLSSDTQPTPRPNRRVSSSKKVSQVKWPFPSSQANLILLSIPSLDYVITYSFCSSIMYRETFLILQLLSTWR